MVKRVPLKHGAILREVPPCHSGAVWPCQLAVVTGDDRILPESQDAEWLFRTCRRVTLRAQMLDDEAVLLDHSLGDQRAMTRLGVALDTEQRDGSAIW